MEKNGNQVDVEVFNKFMEPKLNRRGAKVEFIQRANISGLVGEGVGK